MLRIRSYVCSYPTANALGADPVPYQSDLQNFIRTFPKCVTAKQMTEALTQAAEFGRKVIAAQPFEVNTKPLSQAVQRARDLDNTWRGRLPWFWQNEESYCKGAGPLYDEAFKAIVSIYEWSSAAAGGGETVKEARQQLRRDLQSPLDPGAYWGEFWKNHKMKIYIGGAIIAGLMIKRFLSEKSTSAPVHVTVAPPTSTPMPTPVPPLPAAPAAPTPAAAKDWT